MNVLLYFDGVFIQNNNIDEIIKDKSIRYVRKRTHLPFDSAKTLNKRLYRSLGHTALILNNMQNYHHEVLEYNKYVFHDMNFDDEIRPCFDTDDFEHIENIIDVLRRFNKKPGLFTNTPLIWVEQNLHCLGLDIDEVFDTDMLFTSDDGFIKPKLDTYQRIYNHLACNHTLFLDDSLTNIKAASPFENWVGFHVPKGRKKLLYTYLNLIHTIAKY